MVGKGPRRFALLRKLGEGSIGVVYEAYDREREMRVALKTLRRLDKSGLVRLRQEFRAARGMSHPNVVTLHELIKEGNSWFIVMELVEGEDFVTYARMGAAAGSFAADESRLRHVLVQLVQALHAIHLAGLIHRDLKPSNVRVTAAGRVVVMDFSIVAEARNALDQTSSGTIVIGTPWYMAPEQAVGDPPTAAADWYSLGVLLYETITGHVPFEGPWDEVLLAKQQDDAIPPSELAGNVPADLGDLCVRLLARKPQDRPSGQEVLQSLGLTSQDMIRVAASATGESAFVGRETELAVLADALSCASGGEPVGVLVRGPAGMGKSRLLQHFVDSLPSSAEDPVIALRGFCKRTDSVPFKALDGVMDQLSRVLFEHPGQLTSSFLPEGVGVLMTLFPVFGRVPDIQLAPHSKEPSGRELIVRASAALRSLLHSLASQRLLVLCIDDFQWVDEDSLKLLGDLFAPPLGGRILLLAAMQTEAPDGSAANQTSNTSSNTSSNAFIDQPWFRHIDLRPLAPDAQRRLIGRTGIEYADLTPLHVAEIGHYLAQQSGQDSGNLSPDGPESNPPGLDQLILDRVSRLTDPERKLLEATAIAGEPVPLSIAAEAGNLNRAKSERVSAILRSARLVRTDRPGREPWLTPYHHLVAEIVAENTPQERRRDIHQRLAMAFERSGVAPAGLLAYHWYQGGDVEQAFDYLVEAAQAASDRLAFAHAAKLYQAARRASLAVSQYSDDLEHRRRELLPCLATALALAGRPKEAAQIYDQASEAGTPAGDEKIALRFQAVDGWLCTGQIDTALERMWAIADELDIPAAARKRGAWGGQSARTRLALRSWRNRLRDPGEIAARDLAELDSLYAMIVRASAIDFSIAAPLQAEHLNRTLRHAEKARLCRGLAMSLPYLAALGGRSLKRAEALGPGVVTEAERLTSGRVLGVAHLGMGAVHFLAGRPQAAVPHASAALTRVDSASHWERSAARYLLCRVRIQCGELADAAAMIERALAEARRFGDSFVHAVFGSRPNTWRLMRADRASEALESLAASAAVWQKAPAVAYAIAIAQVMGHVYLGEAGAAQAAAVACMELADIMPIAHIPWLDIELHSVLGRVALLCGDRAEATNTARYLARMRRPTASAHSDLLHAALAGPGERAEQFLRDAIARFSEVGAVHFAVSAKFRLGQIVGYQRGQDLIAEATTWCQKEGIVNAERMFDYLSPRI